LDGTTSTASKRESTMRYSARIVPSESVTAMMKLAVKP